MKRLAFITLFFVMIMSCKEYVDTPLSPAEKKRVDAARLSAPPTPTLVHNITIEDQLKLIGIDLSTQSLKAGDKAVATFYLEAINEVMEDNKIFIHFQCRGAKGFQNLDGRSITQRVLPLRKLKRGDIIADRIEFQVGRNCLTGKATIYWGLFRGADRLKFVDAPKKLVSRDGRLIAATLQLRSIPKPVMNALKINQPILIDGALSEVDWSKAQPIYLSRIGGTAARFQATEVKVMFDENHVYIGAVATDSDVWSTFEKRDSNTWEQEVIEVFIDAGGKGRNYLELQVTPRNVVFDGKFERHRSDLSVARAWNMAGLETAVAVDGTLNQRNDKDARYTIEIKVPIKEVPDGLTGIKKGEWRINFFRFDMAKDKRQQASGWSPPPVPDFHHLASFGRLKFPKN